MQLTPVVMKATGGSACRTPLRICAPERTLSPMKSIKKVFFGTSTIQKARRIALDPNLLSTLELQEGDTVRIDLDVDTATILIRKDMAADSERKPSPEKAHA